MNRLINFILLALLISPNLMAGEDYNLWKEAKKYWYGEKWDEAAQTYEILLKNHPDSPFHYKSMYFLAYCEKKKGNDDRAFELVSQLIGEGEAQSNDNLIEDAKSLRLLIAYQRAKSQPSFKTVLRDALKDKSSAIRFQAASDLAELGERNGVNVLFEFIENTQDTDLRDLAIKKLLLVADEKDKKRLNAFLQEKRSQPGSDAPRMLRLVVRDLTSDNEAIKVNVPEKLLAILLKSLTPEQRDLIEQNNVDLDLLSREIRNMPPNTIIFEISDKNQEIKLILD